MENQDDIEFNTYTDKLSMLKENDNIVSSPKKITKTMFSSSKMDYKKYLYVLLGVYFFSLLVTYYFIDPKYYSEETDGKMKTNKKHFFFCSVCVTLFLIIYFYSFRIILRKVV